MRFRIPGVSAALLLMLAGAALAADQEDVTKLPGYVDFGAMNIFGKEEATVEVFLQSNLINLVAAATRSSDPDLSDMLAKLKQIRVQTFSIEPGKLEALQQKTAEVCKRLEQNGWQTVVRVRQARENSETYVYMKWVDNLVSGLVVMSVDPHDEASFVNIVGELDPEQLGRLGSKFNIDSLDSLETQIKGHTHTVKGKDKDADKPKKR